MKHKLAVFALILALMAADSALASTLTLPTSLKTIKKNAFSGNTSLTSVTVGNQVTEIEEGAFADCTKLASVSLGSKVETIGDSAFSNTVLKKITFGDSVQSIGSGAFQGCAKLASVTLGSKVETIGDSAFANTAVTEMTFGSSVQSIGSGAFQNCTSLRKVTFNNPDITIEDGAFEGCSNVTVYAKPNSAVWNYAKEKSEIFVFPTYQAVVVGQNAYSSTSVASLQGCVEDAEHMQAMLEDMEGTKFKVDIKENVPAAKITSAIGNMKSGAGSDQDVTLFYYAGHGYKGGILIGINYNSGFNSYDKIEPSDLKKALDGIPGEKVVIIDACFSGGLIGKGDGEEEEEQVDFEEFAEAFMEPFTLTDRSGELAASHYHVIVSCSLSEESYSLNDEASGERYGIFTYGLMEGIGYNRLGTVSRGTMKADDGDGKLTMQELFDYTAQAVTDKVQGYKERHPDEEVDPQTVTFYSDEPDRVIFIPSL